MRRSTLLIEAAFVFSLIGLSAAAPKESKPIAQVAAVSAGPTTPEPLKKTTRLVAEVPGRVFESPPIPEGVQTIMRNTRLIEWRERQRDNYGGALQVAVLDYESPLEWLTISDPENPSNNKPLNVRVYPEPDPYGELRGIIPQGQPFRSQYSIRSIFNAENNPRMEIFNLVEGPGYVAHQLGKDRFTTISGFIKNPIAPRAYPVVASSK